MVRGVTFTASVQESHISRMGVFLVCVLLGILLEKNLHSAEFVLLIKLPEVALTFLVPLICSQSPFIIQSDTPKFVIAL